MGEERTVRRAHSEEYFGEYRDFWWNSDFLSLMGARLGLDKVGTVLDVGCGIGHWGQLLAPVLSADAQVTGVDLEAASLAKASERAERRGLAGRYRYRLGDAIALPFGDGTFDFVTCQTVLIHLKEPRDGLREMMRVLRPGGFLLAVEPSNFANAAVASNLTARLSVDEVVERLKFALQVERGKAALGLGSNSEGDLVPGLLAQLGALDIRVHLSDKAAPCFPPYSGPQQEANVRQMKDWTAREFLGWEPEVMRGYYLAGGGDPLRFDFHWNIRLKDAREAVEAVDAAGFHTAGGGVTYLVSARKGESRP